MATPRSREVSSKGRESLILLEREIADCTACPRLVAHRERIAAEKRRAYLDQDYWGRPVPSFGTAHARLIVVGLAPGAHGANRTGRMFTGDSSGDFLYPALYRQGFATRPHSASRHDGLKLLDTWITNAVRCAPPENRPDRREHEACRPYLCRELRLLPQARVYLALGGVALHEVWLSLCELNRARGTAPRFRHGLEQEVDGGRVLLASYHPSRQNTQTGRLTAAMLDAVLARAKTLLHQDDADGSP